MTRTNGNLIYTKVNPALYVVLTLLIFVTLLSFNKYVLIADVIVGYVVVDYFRTLKALRAVEVSVYAKGRVFANEPFKVRFVLRSSTRLEIVLSPPVALKKEPRFVELEPDSPAEVVFSSSFGTRGSKKLGPFTIKITLYGGLLTVVRVEELDSDVKVLPGSEEAEALVERLLEAIPILKTKAKLADDFSYIRDVREYNGEPLNRVHWKNSARFGKLMVKDFENSGTARIFILLDLNLPGGVYSKAAWTHIRRKYEEDAIRAVTGLVGYFLKRHERVVLYVSDAKGFSKVEATDEGIFFDHLADATGTTENTKDTSELLSDILQSVQPADTVLIVSMFLTREEVREIMRLKGRCARVAVLLMPYGFRSAGVKKFRTYYEAPPEIRALYEYAKILREENVIIEVWLENVSLQEGLQLLTGPEGGAEV